MIPKRDEHNLSQADKSLALLLWKKGFDTEKIGQHMGLCEYVIYNNLHIWRRENAFQTHIASS